MRTFLLFLLIIGYAIFLSAQKQLSLQESISIALNRNTTLIKSTNSLKGSESNVKAATGNFLPNISADLGWQYSRNELRYETSPFNFDTTTESRNYGGGIGSSWVLFDGLSNLAAHSKSENELEAAKYDVDRLKQDIVFQTISLYYDVINTMEQLKFREEDVKGNQKNLETITERNRLGSVTLADVYAQQVRVGNAELEVILTSNQLETNKSELLSFLGLDVLEEYVFTDTIFTGEIDKIKQSLAKDYQNLGELVAKALENRYDYKSAQLNLESADDGITIARAGHFPSLVNTINYRFGADQIRNSLDNRYLDVGFTLRIPILSGFSVENNVQFAEILAENRQIEMIELERDIKKSIKKTYLDLQAAEKALKVSEGNVLASQENLKIESEKYSLGAGTLLNVLVANSAYMNAKTDFTNAQFAYITFSEQLKYHLGIIDFKSYETSTEN
jgi:outer membrane protein